MGKFIVTKEDIPRIVTALLQGDFPIKADDLAAPLNLEVNWSYVLLSVAVDLCTDMEKSRNIKKNLHQGKISNLEALTQILDQWVEESGQSQSSTIDKLKKVLSLNGFKSLAGKLKSVKLISHEEFVPRRSLRMRNEEPEPDVSFVFERSAKERALANCVIIEEIFKHLSLKDRKSFRLVKKFWMEETFRYWRRTTWIRIEIYSMEGERGPLTEKVSKPMTLPPYFKIFLELSANESQDGNFGINKSNLQRHPFRRLSISSHVYLPVRQKEDRKLVKALWKSLGPHVTHLKLNGVKLGWSFEVLEMLLLKTCPNLEELQVNGCHSHNYDHPYKFGFNPWRKKITYTENTVAKNLRTLLLSPLIAGQASELYDYRDLSSNILKFCPKLEVLDSRKESNLEALLQPSLTGEVIKLESLTINFPSQTQTFTSLKNYIEMFPSSIQHLDISNIELSRTRTSPFNLYTALAKCASSLKTLKLHNIKNLAMTYDYYQRRNGVRAGTLANPWFMDLSAIPFPNLTKLTFSFEGDIRGSFRNALRFDFATLRNMQMLEELEVIWAPNYISSDTNLRKPYSDDYFFSGPRRDIYLPSGILLPNSNSTDAPVYTYRYVHNNLKKLSFNCWPLNSSDVYELPRWFPILTHLTAGVTRNACSYILRNINNTYWSPWRKLETLTLLSTSSVTLSQLQMLKEERENLKIIQHARPFPAFVVKKGENGVVFEDFSTV